MRDYNEIFGYETFAGVMTAAQLKRRTERIKEYKGYSIAFGKYQRDAEGRAWWSVRVWKNEGKDRFGTFTMKSLCATDGDAMAMATRWAKANIDRIAA
ncbi:MAG: hypothetical protein NC427_02540 [Ruminococcus flavefaciens]|nr:hypothetical protein [Ruminococcus flavefaciens]